MRRIAWGPVSRETQEHVAQAESSVEAGQLGRGRRQGGRRLAVQYEWGVLQGILESVRSGKAREGECLTGAGHGHVIQPARGVRVLPAANPVPAAIQHNHVVELKALGAMGRQ